MRECVAGARVCERGRLHYFFGRGRPDAVRALGSWLQLAVRGRHAGGQGCCEESVGRLITSHPETGGQALSGAAMVRLLCVADTGAAGLEPDANFICGNGLV